SDGKSSKLHSHPPYFGSSAIPVTEDSFELLSSLLTLPHLQFRRREIHQQEDPCTATGHCYSLPGGSIGSDRPAVRRCRSGMLPSPTSSRLTGGTAGARSYRHSAQKADS